jgi:signal transduction histidine kinase
LGKKKRIDNLVFIFSDVTKKKEVERMQSEFVFILSHQLQEPITSIRWNTELLLDKKIGDLTKAQKSFLKDIYQSAAKMINLFSNLLNISDISSGTLSLSLEPIQITKVVKGVVDELQPLARSCNIELITQLEKNLPVVNVDRLKIDQAIQNIIENALYYGKKGRVVVSLKKAEGRIVFSCQDDGIGIAAKAQSKIFHKFFRDSNAKKVLFKGSGLGLYIAKVFVEKMPGGKIWFYSDGLNRGSVFYVSFPIHFFKKTVLS